MGVDAEMMARVRREEALKEKEVLDLSWRICEALGRDTFWINRDGELGNGHALSIHVPGIYVPEGYEHLYGTDDQLIEVSLMSRYYGEGYERGPLMDFIAIAKWLEFNLPKGTEIYYGKGAEIYYGSDNAGPTELFDKQRRKELFNHWAKYGHTPYTGARTVLKLDESSRWCDFCEHAMTQYGFGGKDDKYAAYICYGCGLKEKTDDGETWVEEK